ncbi:hypothetical protein [Haliangium sp.]|uniref:hypothetical protein n=1 Tax=Haliangium sp. TaxID=2663208 RepID=UPI003D0C3D21
MTPTSLVPRLVPALMLLAPACGGAGGEDSPSPEQDACEHMIEGPAQSATAVADLNADGPDLGEHHMRWDITLDADGAGGFDGYADLVVAEAGEALLFWSLDVPIELRDPSGAVITIEATLTDVAACAEVEVGHTFDLGVGTYLMHIGPSASDQVSLVVVPSDEHGHEE